MRKFVSASVRANALAHDAGESQFWPSPAGAEPFLSSAEVGRILAADPGAASIHPPSATIVGTTGNDVLTGTAGADYIEDKWGDDQIDGGGGDDIIVDWGGSNILRGGTGNDFIHRVYMVLGTLNEDDVNTSLIEAGDGADFVRIDIGVHQRMTIDLGAGNDQLRFGAPYLFDNDVLITTGSGADRIVLDNSYGRALLSNGETIVIADFTAGAGGDILDLGGMIEGLLVFQDHPANPLAGGYLRLIQDGADVIVRVDVDGNGPGNGDSYVRDVARLTNVSLGALTAYNFAGYALDGGALARTSASGTAAGEWLSADVGGSDLFGLAGNDRLNGGIGDDLVDGGADNDVIDGGLGDDLLRGGAGDDILTDDYGNDVFEGGEGSDIIVLVRPAVLYSLPSLHETIIIDAGGGDDLVSFQLLPRTLESQAYHTFTLRIDLGAGNDRFEIFSLFPDTRLTLGAGQDHVVISDIAINSELLIITDFAAGNAGDVLDLDRTILGGQGWDGVSNPFASGHLVLRQAGADTLVLFDYDGAAGSDQSVIHVLAQLLNVNAAALTAYNFGGYAPNGSPSAYLPGIGTAGNDDLFGTNGSDVIDGGAGDDWIEESKTGNDILSGGDGNDVIIVNHYNYQQLPEVITIDAGTGNDRVESHANYGRVNVDLGAGDDWLELFAATELGTFITLGAGADVVKIDSGFANQVGDGLITIADFATGAGGDRLDWILYSGYQSYNHPTEDRAQFGPVLNPFLTDHFRLVQSGADTLLQVGKMLNGTANPLVYVNMILFRNTVAAAFTPYNIGFETYLATQNGGTGNDILTGTAGKDVLFGNDGNDELNGLGSDDLLRGYDGNDILAGGAGDDYLVGGRGDDNLAGGGDDDYLDGGQGRNLVDGGAGDDIIYSGSSQDVITGGDGNDRIDAAVYLPGSGTLGSLDAGDGNDLVTLDSAGPVSYAVNLGAGDDIIRFNRAFGPLTLGSGRDTIVYNPPYNAAGDVDIVDFTPGDAGDIFDLRAYITGRAHSTAMHSLAVLDGRNPFALGYIELRQIGDDVELYLWREGFPDDDIYSKQEVIRFLDTTLAAFTAANFGGFDPHVPPNRSTIVTGNMTVAAGQVLEAVDIAPSSGGSTHLVFRAPDHIGDLNFVNHGTIISRSTPDGIGGVTGAYISEWTSGGSFINAADGSFIVRGETVPVSGIAHGGETMGFRTFGVSLFFRNDGHFEVSAASGIAKGVLSGYDVFHGYGVVNTGTFTVTSAYEAYGVELGGNGAFSNSGNFIVSAGEFAVGVWLRNYRSGQFNNQGTITVTTDPSSPYGSIGVLADHGLGSNFAYYNSGTITADIAFYSDDRDFPSTDNGDDFYNSGQIVGDMVMGNGADRLINTGTMSGDTDLGAGRDVYDGYVGLYTGIVDGGGHDDLLVGGRGEETLLGGTGTDQIYGGSGDDLIDGGRGSDALDGGAGFDIVFYVDALKGVTVDFAQGIATGNGNDRIRNIEGVVGSAYADVLTGANSDDYLEGAGGNDVISGGAGADLILGDTGDDMLTGGAGGDIFAVSTGDGADIVTDFNVLEDRLEIHGFTAALQIQQVGADTLVVLAANQNVLLRNVQATSLTGSQLVFDPVPLGPAPAPDPLLFDTQIRHGAEGFRLYSGEVLRIVDPAYFHQDGVYVVRNTGVDCHVEGGTASAIVGGSLTLEVSGSTGIAKGFFLPYEVTVLSTGSIEVLTSGTIAAVGIYGGGLLNAGHVRVVSTNSGVPVLDAFDHYVGPLSSAVGAWADSGAIFINNGTVEVSSTGISTGLVSYNNNDAGRGMWNSGDILVTGGLGSYGVLLQGQAHSASQGPSFVNSGDIVVSDATALADSVGLALSFVVLAGGAGAGAKVWNSGLIQADYAIKWYVSITPDKGGMSTIYNSGELRGLVDLSAGAESIYNTGLITGRIDLREGNDLFDGRGGVQAAGVFGAAGNDTLLGGSGIDTIDGGADEDIIAGGGGNDLLTGGAGNDTFQVEAGFGADVITDFVAGTGQDSIQVSGYANYQSVQQQGADTLVVFSATDTILLRNVLAANLTVLDFTFSAPARPPATIPAAPGQPAPTDFPMNFDPPPLFVVLPPLNLVGTSAGDTLVGGDGDDMLDGAGGADVLEGGLGNDTYIVDNGADLIREQAGAGTDLVYTSVSYALAASAEVETLSTRVHGGTDAINLIGNEFAQTIIGNFGANVIDGRGGADVMVGFAGDDLYVVDNALDQVLEGGGQGNDTIVTNVSYVLSSNQEIETLSTQTHAGTDDVFLTGNQYNNKLIGNAGDNILNGVGGADVMIGLDGDDTYAIDDAGDLVVDGAGQGNDLVLTYLSHTLTNGNEIETLSTVFHQGTTAIDLGGNDHNNTLIGNYGANYLNGNGGVDVMIGLNGNDIYVAENAADVVVEDAGGGTDALYSFVSYALAAGQEVETLSTAVQGGTAALALTGNEYAQTMIGNYGANLIDGKGGNDLLYGLNGADTFAFTTALGAGNVDTIGDFLAGTDKIGLDDAIFTAIGGTLNASAFVIGTAAGDLDDRIIYNQATGQLFYDADGSGGGAAVQFATLSGAPVLTASDFTMI